MTCSNTTDTRESGFSLVELSVYVVVLGLIATVLATVMVSLFRSEETVSKISAASNNAQIFATVLDRDVRNAVAAGCGSVGGTVTDCAISGATTIALSVQSTSASPACVETVVWSFDGDTVTRLGGSGGSYTVEADAVDFALSGRTVSFNFTTSGPGESSQHFAGSAALSPVTNGGEPC
jgi:type II secretory pathway component PulJ